MRTRWSATSSWSTGVLGRQIREGQRRVREPLDRREQRVPEQAGLGHKAMANALGVEEHGEVLAGNAAWREGVVPKVPTSSAADQAARAALKLVKHDNRRRRAAAGQPEPLGWADLLRRVFGVDGWLCPECGQPMRLRAVVLGAPATSRVIAGLLRARGPPDHEHHVEVRGA